MKRFFREPLIHFLVLGFGLFMVYGYLNTEGEEDPQKIVVDRDDLLTYIQYRSKAFDAERFNKVLDNMPEEDLQRVIDDYVREEALYREAKALRLDKNDYVSRLRLIQQLEYITRGFISAAVDLSEEQIADYYDKHKENYFEEPTVTFTHVFFNNDRHGQAEAKKLAEAKVKELNQKRVIFSEAVSHGDRFFYHVNYVEKERDFVASHFNEDFEKQVFALEPSDSIWRGPFESPYGYHVVMLTTNKPGYQPTLAEVRPKVEQDAIQAALDKQFEESIQDIVGAYKVEVVNLQKPEAEKKDS